MIGFFGYSWFLDHYCLLSTLQHILVWKKPWHLGSVGINTTISSVGGIIRLLVLESYWTPKPCGSIGLLCSWGSIDVNGALRNDEHTYCTTFSPQPACSIVPSDFTLQNVRSKIKLWRIGGSWAAKYGPFWAQGPVWLHRWHARAAWSASRVSCYITDCIFSIFLIGSRWCMTWVTPKPFSLIYLFLRRCHLVLGL